MPSSSLFLGLRTTLVTLSFFSSTLAAPQNLASRAATTPAYVYSLDQEFSGANFFNNFNFYPSSDPTHGFVTYGDRSYAQANGLVGFDGEYAVMRVDSTTNLGKGRNYYRNNGNGDYYSTNGVGRKSVRIESAYQFTHGLMIADIGQMPGGICGTWPAFWTLGQSEWPTDGEIDIIEGANAQGGNSMSLHTGSTSNIVGDQDSFSASITSTDCNVDLDGPNPNYTGCEFVDGDTSTYSNYGGGVWAMQWTSDRIKVWYWPYGSVPRDVTSNSPQPGTSAWGTPRSSFAPPENLNIDQNFRNHRIIFDTTFCGDLGDATWASTGCAAQTGYGSCADFVANSPSAFADAQWKIKYVKVFAEGSASVTTTTSSRTTTTTTRRPNSTSSPVLTLTSPTTTVTTKRTISSSLIHSTPSTTRTTTTAIITSSTTSPTDGETFNPTLINPTHSTTTALSTITDSPSLTTSYLSDSEPVLTDTYSTSTTTTSETTSTEDFSTPIFSPILVSTTTSSESTSIGLSNTHVISPILVSTTILSSPTAESEATVTDWQTWSTSTAITSDDSWVTWSSTLQASVDQTWITWESTTSTLSSIEALQTWSSDDFESGSEPLSGKPDDVKQSYDEPATTTKRGGGFYPGRPGHGDGSDSWVTTTITDIVTVPCQTAPGFETKTTVYVTIVPSKPVDSETWSNHNLGSPVPVTTAEDWNTWTPTDPTNIKVVVEPSATPVVWTPNEPSKPNSANKVNDPSATWNSWQPQRSTHGETANGKSTSTLPSAWPAWVSTTSRLPVISVTLKPQPVTTSTDAWGSWASASVPADSTEKVPASSTGAGESWNGWTEAAQPTGDVKTYKGAAASVTADVCVLTALALAVLSTMFVL